MQDTGKESGPGYPRPAVQTAVPAAVAVRDTYGLAAMPANGGEDAADLARSLMQYVHIAIKRKWLILSVVFGVVALGLLKAVLATPCYTANVRIQIDREAMKVLDRGVTVPQEEGGTDFLKTQFELLKSRAMAERVVTALRLNNDADFLESAHRSLLGSVLRFVTGPGASANAQDTLTKAVGLINSGVDIRPVQGARLVDVSYTDPSPVRAQKIANAYADAYMASNVD